jgi:putative SOS response-associated peptidase YedK
MSRLYKVEASAAEIAAHFQAEIPAPIGVPDDTVEGTPGLVVLEANGRRLLKSMHWGFPRLTREMRLRGESPGRLGLVADLTNPMWRELIAQPRYRCLIPLTHFANPAGIPREKTRTWFSMTGAPLVAWAGFCRNTPEFGPVYCGMTTAANDLIMPYNDRMPVLLGPEDYERWLHSTAHDVIDFQFRPPITSDKMAMSSTDALWRSGIVPAQRQPHLAL